LVAHFFWAESAYIRTDYHYGNVGADCNDNEEVLSAIETGVLFASTLSVMGEFCHAS